MNYRVYEPGEAVSDERLGMVYLNQGFSSINHDAGRDAQILADRFGIQVIAANRPGSGVLFSRNRRLADTITEDYVSAMTGLARELSGEVDELSLNRLIVCGRSAAGLGTLALTCTELLPVGYAYAAEPAGWRKIEDLAAGKQSFDNYNIEQKQYLESDDPDLVRPERPDVKGFTLLKRNLTIPLLFWGEKYHNQRLWSQPISAELATKVASDHPDVDTTLEFADFSLVAPREDEAVSALIFSLPHIRRDAGPDAAPYSVDRVAHTVHASFDLRSFFGDRLEPIVERAKAA